MNITIEKMKTRLRLICILCLVAGSIGVKGAGRLPFATAEEVGMDPSKLRKVKQAVGEHLDQDHLAGAVTMVLRQGKIVSLEAHGWQDLDSRRPMQTDTLFRIYSMTKPIVSAGVMMLVEKGEIKLDKPIADYLPELEDLQVYQSGSLTAPKRPPSVRDLLRHTAGFTYGLFGDSMVDRQYRQARLLDEANDSKTFLDKVAKLPLVYHPGSQWVYSISVDLQGVLIERASGKSLDRYLREHFFEPLEMPDTGFYVPPEKRHRFATYYGEGLESVESNEQSAYRFPPRFFSGGGGLVSTVEDYAHFLQMLLNEGKLFGRRILKKASIEEMTRNQLEEPAFPIGIGDRRDGFGFGLGFSVVTAPSGYDPDARVGEYGWGGIASTHFWVSPDDALAVITMEQTQPYNWNLERGLKGIIYGAIKKPLTP
ncbi:beta-lactamase family protein [Verrucomicrobia bacterium]|nr:beta-lactamase family protein [Verrucomicrobiota bacterium]